MPGDDRSRVPGASVAGVWGEAAESLETPTEEHAFSIAERRRYERGGLLGVGGMGRVLSARDLRLDREVALKEALPELGSIGSSTLAREARITARLEHPGIVGVHDAGTDETGRPWYTMRVMRGRTLHEVLEGAGPEERRSTLRRVVAACEAIAYAHSRGVIHRDIKPRNILLGEFGETQVADWGLAREVDSEEGGADGSGGTPEWMSPEQGRGDRATPRSDVWSLGAILRAVLADDELPELAAIVTKATQDDPAQRYRDAGELAEDLERYLDGHRVRAHEYTPVELIGRLARLWKAPLLVAGVAALVVAIAVGAGWNRTAAERVRAEGNLARALVQQARVAEGRGLRAEAEVLAAHALSIRESPQARGVFAAFSGDDRPVRRAAATDGAECDGRWVLPDGTRLCARGEILEARGALSPAVRWSRSFADDLHVMPTSGGALFVAGMEEGGLMELDPETGRTLLSRAKPIYAQRVVRSSDGRFTAAWRALDFALHDELEGTDSAVSGCGGAVIVGVTFTEQHLVVLCADRKLRRRPLVVGAGEEIPFEESPIAFDTALIGIQALRSGRLVVATGDGALLTVDFTEGEIVDSIQVTDHPIPELDLHPAGDRLAMRSEQGGIAVWEIETRAVLRLPGTGVQDVAWGTDGTLLTAGRTATAWNLAAPEASRILRTVAGFSTVRVSPDGETIVGARGDGRVVIWRPGGGPPRSVQVFSAVVKDVGISADGASALAVAAVGSGRVSVRLIDLGSGTLSAGGAPGPLRRAVLLPEGRVLALNWGTSPVLLEGLEGAPISLDWDGGPHWDLALDRSRRRVAVMGKGPVVRTAGIRADGIEAAWSSPVDKGLGVAIHRSGRVAVGTDAGVRIFEEGGQRERLLPAPVLRAVKAAISPSGRLVAAGDLSGAVWIWDADANQGEGRLLAELRGHEGRVPGVVFRSEEELVTAGWDGTIRRWDLRSLHVDPSRLLEAAGSWELSLEEVLGESL